MEVRTICGDTSKFPLIRGMHQGLALSSYLFEVIMNQFTTHIKEEVPRFFSFLYFLLSFFFFANDIVFVNESRDGMQRPARGCRYQGL